MKGKVQYNSSPCAEWFRSAALDNPNIISFFTKQAVLNLPLQLVIPVYMFETKAWARYLQNLL